jgi:hypothetical protein
MSPEARMRRKAAQALQGLFPEMHPAAALDAANAVIDALKSTMTTEPVRSVVLGYGFTEDEIDNVFDLRLIRLLTDFAALKKMQAA